MNPPKLAHATGDRLPKFKHETLLEMFDQVIAKFRLHSAISDDDIHLRFEDLDELSGNIAAYLMSTRYLNQGDRVAIVMNNCAYYGAVAWGIIRAGLVVVNTNPAYTPRELRFQLSNSGCKTVFADEEVIAKISSWSDHTDIREIIVNGRITDGTSQQVKMSPLVVLLQGNIPYEKPRLSPGSIALLQYTGGTTGRSKGAMLTHGSISANAQQCWSVAPALERGKEIVICPLPLYHVYAFVRGLVEFMLQGSHIVIIRNPKATDEVITMMQRHPFSVLFGIYSLYVKLLAYPATKSLSFDHLKLNLCGGAPMTRAISEKWAALSGRTVTEGYGLTEASPVVTSNVIGKERPGTSGRPLPNTSVKLINDSGKNCNVGNSGELCVKGPQIMRGYWRFKEETRRVFTGDGWLKTGDIASIDQDGYVTIIDRIKDVIVVSGFNVYPYEIEHVVGEHPDILECAAIGVDSERSGQSIKLYVVSSNGSLTDSDIKDFCKRHLVAYKVPKLIEFVAALPKTNVGKISKLELRQRKDDR